MTKHCPICNTPINNDQRNCNFCSKVLKANPHLCGLDYTYTITPTSQENQQQQQPIITITNETYGLITVHFFIR